MDSLLLLFLLLGATPDGSPDQMSHAGAHAQAVASATILRGETVAWDASARRATGLVRSAGTAVDTEGRTIAVQEFH